MVGRTEESSALDITEETIFMDEQAHNIPVDWFTKNVFNRMVRTLTKLGISVMGSRVLRVRGRKSGDWRTTPVNLMTVNGEEYLVAPRGTTQWVLNMRVAGGGELQVGRRIQTFTADELPDQAKLPVLREYMRRWWFEVGSFFPELSKTPTDEELMGVAARCPAFKLNLSS
jgi:deazaflavin-dependent oxidoreductase (nitroreductase family)